MVETPRTSRLHAARAVAAALCMFAGACGGRIAAEMHEAAPSETSEGGAIRAPTREPAGDETPPSVPGVDGSPSDASVVADVQDAPDDGEWCGDVRALPECVAYEKLLESCLFAPPGFACEDHVRPDPDADLDSIRSLCAANLDRLQMACR